MTAADQIDQFLKGQEEPIESKLVVRLSTSYWHTERGCFSKTSINFLKSKSSGFNVLAEDCMNIGAEEVIPRIVNLDSCEDGIYELIICNKKRDWETGAIEEWDYKLIPLREEL